MDNPSLNFTWNKMQFRSIERYQKQGTFYVAYCTVLPLKTPTESTQKPAIHPSKSNIFDIIR
jgi:hypothetical protein